MLLKINISPRHSLAVGLFVLLMLMGCSNSPVSSQHQIFHYNESSGISTLDPAFARNQSVMWAVHQLYNTLVETDSTLRPGPSIARTWSISPNRLVYTFYLRKDVFFHNDPCFRGGKGRRLTAHDVVYSFKRVLDPAVASPGSWIFNNRVDSVNAFTALNDSVFELRLKAPFAPMLGVLSMQYCSIVPFEAVDKYGAAFRQHPVGTGPFCFSEWEEGQSLILLKNQQYWEKDKQGISLPYLDAVKISFLASKATEFLLFRQQKLDFINDIDPSFKDELITRKGELRSQWKGTVELQKHSYLNTEYLGILVDTSLPANKLSPLQNKYVRQAINYGFDRAKMMLYLRNSIGKPAESGFVCSGHPSFDPVTVKGYCYNPEKARALLKSAGFPGGIGLGPLQLSTIPAYANLAGFIASQLNELGMRVQVDVLRKSVLLDQAAQSQLPFFRASWIADYPDAENFLSLFYSKNPAPPNYTRYHNNRFDMLYEQALQETNDSVRYELYRKMDQLVIEDAPVVPLWYDEVFRLLQPYVSGFYPNSLNLLELRTTRLRKH